MALPVIAVTNASTVLTDDQVQAVIHPLQRQVDEHFKAFWDLECELVGPFDPGSVHTDPNTLPAGWWQLVVIDNPDLAGALGYHELSSQGTPLGKVFAKLDLDSGQSWTTTLSHELLEMLADPWINWCAEGSDGNVYALEVCDPVEADNLGYEIDGVLLSDFITSSWFEPTEADRYDFKQRLTKPFEIAPGGYMSVLESNGWTQISADKKIPNGPSGLTGLTFQRVSRLSVTEGSRRQRRTIPRAEWRKSER